MLGRSQGVGDPEVGNSMNSTHKPHDLKKLNVPREEQHSNPSHDHAAARLVRVAAK